MSAIRQSRPTAQANKALTAITGGKLNRLMGRGQAKSRVGFVLTTIFGLVLIQALQLMLNVAIADTTYAIKDLKDQKDALVLQQQILSEQVDSLSSNQNLANTAQKMGMISNANPVFLRLSDQKVFGKPKAALNADNRLSRNLIPSSQLTVVSNIADPNATTTADQLTTGQGQLSLVSVPTAGVSATTSASATSATATTKPAAGLTLTTVGSAPAASTGIPAQPTR